jgi:hypothetical protein
MAITRYAGDRFTANTSDTKPTGVLDGAYLIDTGNLTQYVRRTAGGTSQWSQLAGGGGGGGTPGGANTQVQFNNAGAFGGDADLTFTDGNRLNVNKLGISGNIYDSNNSIGNNGMVLTNEGTTGVNWKSIESVLSGVGGSGVANYVARWSDEDTITSGVIQDDGTAVGINQAADPDNALAIKSIANNTNPLQIAAHDGDSLLVFRQTAGDGRLSIKKDGGIETIRLDSDNVSYITGANFGLGTAAPAAPLDVQSANGSSVAIRVTSGYKLQFLNASNNTNSNIYNNGASGVAQMAFQIAGLTKVTINNDGNVGIGTTDPGGKLESYITSGGQKGLRLNSNFAGGNTVDFIPAIVGVSNAGFSIDLAGTNRLVINSGGNVGVGTNSPSHRLHVLGATTGGWNGLNLNVVISSSNTYANGHAGGIAFGGAYNSSETQTVLAGIWASRPNAGDGQYAGMVHIGAREHGTSNIEKVINVSHASVGVGTATPGTILHITQNDAVGPTISLTNNPKTAYINFWGATGAGGDRTNQFEINAVHTGYGITLATKDYIRFKTDGIGAADEAMRIDTDGNVGIGTTSPDAHLHVEKSAGTTTVLTQVAANSIVGYEIKKTGSTTQHWKIVDGQTVNGTLEFYDATDSLTRMAIDGNGNVGIGTTIPTTRLQVKDSVDNTYESGFSVVRSADGATTWINLRGGATNFNNRNNAGNAGLKYRWFQNSSEKMTLDTNGNLGIGTDNPQQLLHINGSSPIIRFRDSAATGTPLAHIDASGGALKLQADSSNETASSFLTLEVDGSEHVRVIADGKVGIGTTTPDAELQIMNNDSSSYRFGYGGTSDVYFDADDVYFRSDNGGVNQITKKGGSLGIGVVNAEHKLHVAGDAIISGYLYDSTNSTGVDGYVLTSKEDGPQWQQIEDVLSGVGGNGTANYIPKWEDEDTLGDSVIAQSGTAIGIGTNAPSGKLHIRESDPGSFAYDSTADTLIVEGNGDAGITIATAAANTSRIIFASPNDATGAEVKYSNATSLMTIGNTNPGDSLALQAGNGAEAVRIVSGGSVGIGTTNPIYTVHVKAAQGIVRTDSTTGTNRSGFQMANTGGTGFIMATSSAGNGVLTTGGLAYALQINKSGGSTDAWNAVQIGTKDIARMTIDESGNVGIGTNAPEATLTVAGPNYTHAIFRTNQSTASERAGGGFSSLGHSTATSRFARLFLDADGGNFSGSDYFTIEKFGNSGEVKLLQYSNANMSFWVNTSTQAMTIKNDGNVGIGTNAPLAHLMVGAGARNAGAAVQNQAGYFIGTKSAFAGSGNKGLWQGQLHIADDSALAAGIGGAITFGATQDNTNGTYLASIESSRDNATSGQYGASMIFRTRTNGSAVMGAHMVIASDGNVGIGTTVTTAGKLDINGNTIVRGTIYFDGVSSSYIDNASHDLQLRGAGGVSLWTHTGGNWVEQLTVADAGAITFNGAYTFPTAIGSAGQVLKVPSAGTVLEWSTETGPVSGTGTTNTIPRWTGTASLGDSIITVPSNTSVQMAGELTLNYTSPILNIGKLNTSTGNAKLRFNSKNGTAANAFDIQFIKTATEDRLDFLAGGATPRVSFLNGGQVGIGTTSPDSALHVYDTGSGEVRFQRVTGYTGLMRFGFPSGTPSIRTSGGFQIKGSDAWGADLYIKSDGNVGIGGVTNPTGLLQIGNNYTIPGSSYGGNDIYISSTGSHTNYDPYVTNTDDFRTLITISDSGTTGPTKPGLILYNDDTTAGGFSPMLLFAKRETGASPYKAATAAIYARSPLGTGDGDSWIDGELIFATAGAATNGIRQRMVINKEGLVGIGTNAPSAKLHVLGDALKLERTDYAPALKLYNNNASPADDAALGYLQFTGKDNDGTANMVYSEVRGGVQSNTNSAVSGYLSFLTTNNATAVTEAMRIKADGNVGIGTNNPTLPLHIYRASGNVYAKVQNGSTSQAALQLQTATTDGNWVMYIPSNSTNLRFYRGADKVTLTADGGVGIGTTAPSSTLHVNSEISCGADDNNRAMFGYTPSRFYLGTRQSGTNYLNTVSVTSGKVGVGTNDPNTLLHLEDDTATAGLTIQGAGPGYVNAAIVLKATNGTSYRGLGVFMHDAGGDKEWYAGTPYAASDNYIIARKASQASPDYGTAIMANALFTIDNNGNVGIGTTQPGVDLDVNGKLSIGSTNASFDLYNSGTTYLNGNVTIDALLSITGTAASQSIINSSTTDSAAADSYLNIFKTAGSGGGSRATLRVGYNAANCFQISRIRNDANIYINSRQSGSAMVFQIADSAKMTLLTTGQLQLSTYGSGTYTGTAAHQLAVDSSGNIIETTDGGGNVSGSGTNNYLTRWTGTNSVGNSNIFDNGTVGVGTAANLNGKVTIREAGNSATPNHIFCMLSSSAVGHGASIFLKTSTSNLNNRYGARIRAIRNVNNNAAADLAFSLENTAANALAEVVRFTSDGSVGIGTTNPSYQLHVKSSGSQSIAVTSTDSHASVRIDRFNTSQDANLIFQTAAVNKWRLATGLGGNDEKLTIYDDIANVNMMSFKTAVGVGVGPNFGTTEPAAALHVIGDDAKIAAASPTSDAHYLRLKHDNSEGIVDANRGKLKLQSNDDIVYTLGNLGVGTAAPEARVQIAGGNISFGVRLDSATRYIGKGAGTDPDAFAGNSNWMGFASDAANDWITFGVHESGVGGGEAMRINYDKNVGIGTTAPASLLHVGGAAASPHAAADDFVIAPAATDVGMTIRCNSNAGTGSIFFADTAANAQGLIRYNHNTDYMSFSSSGDYFFDTSNGNVGIGTNNPTGKLQIGDNYTINASYGGDDIYIKGTTNKASYDPNIYNTDDFGALITISDSNTVGPTKPGLVLYNDDVTAGGFSPMLLFSKRETGNSPFKATMAGIYARAPLGTGDNNGWIDGELIFATAGAASHGIKQRMVINKEGLVGIGTVTPASLLHIYSSAPVFTVEDGGAWGTNATAYIDLKDGSSSMAYVGVTGADGHLDIKQLKAGSLRLYTNNTEKVSILSSGSVGIGTTSPGSRLHVTSSAIIGDSTQQSTTLTIRATNTAGSPAATTKILMEGYEGRGIGTFYTDSTYSGEEWFCGMNYAGSFNTWNVGYDAAGSQAEYVANTLLQLHYTGKLQLHTYGSGTHTGTAAYQLSVDASGNVIETTDGGGNVSGSGTSGKLTKWSGANALTDSSFFSESGTTLTNTATLTNFSTSSATITLSNYGRLGVGTNSASSPFISYLGNNSTWSGDNALIRAFNGGNRGAKGHASGSNLFKLDFSDACAMIVNKDGSVGIGTTAPTKSLDVNESAYFNDDIYFGNTVLNPASGFSNQTGMGWDKSAGQLQIAANGTAALEVGRHTSTGTVFSVRYASTQKASIDSSGNMSLAGTLTEASSLALKENIEDFTPRLDIINKIRPVKYNKKKESKKEIGLIAEELAELFPELVEKDKNGNPSGVNYSRAVTVLLGGFKELYKEVQELKKRI